MDNEVYGADAWKTIENEFSHIKGIYLDHAGATLYSKSIIEESLSELTKNYFGNPHSRNSPGRLTTDLVDQTRIEILNFFKANPDEYDLIFTSGTTDSLRLVAESFQFSNGGPSSDESSGIFVYMKESHTSVIGMREYFKKCVPCYALPFNELSRYLNNSLSNQERKENFLRKGFLTMAFFQLFWDFIFASTATDAENRSTGNSLFVFPAQCNFSGFKYPLELITTSHMGLLSEINIDFCINKTTVKEQEKKENDWFCLLDAASFVGTNELDLSVWKPDMVALSFYKIFGYPTGIGALIVHRRACRVLEKKYFGGGSVEIVSSASDLFRPRRFVHEKFENGTVNFHAILAIRHGIRNLKTHVTSMKNVSLHTSILAQMLYLLMSDLKYSNGQSVVEIYSHTKFRDPCSQGAIIAFNLLTEKGDYIGYAHVEKVLSLHDIHVRTGCFCNPGACQQFINLSDEDLQFNYLSGHKCGDEIDLINGKPTGAVRVSFGYMSQKCEVIRFVEVLQQTFLRNGEDRLIERKVLLNEKNRLNIELTRLFVYPIKSCGGFSPKSWPITKTGLLYDRFWLIVNEAGAALTQKREPKLCTIKTYIDLQQKKLVLRCHERKSTISMNIEEHKCPGTEEECIVKVCGKVDRYYECDTAVSQWLSKMLGQPALKLLMCCNSTSSLVNDSSFLLLNLNSVKHLMQNLSSHSQKNFCMEDYLTRFRGNFIIEGAGTFEEDNWKKIKIGTLVFENLGPCYRCQMIGVNQNTAFRDNEPLSVLVNLRGKKMPFGVRLELPSVLKVLSIEVGCLVLSKK